MITLTIEIPALDRLCAWLEGRDKAGLLEAVENEIVAKLTEMIEGLDKKSTGEKKLTDQQVANLGYKADILTFLTDGQKRTATEILNGVESFPDGMTNQRVSALLRQLWLDGKVQKDTVKGKTLFFTAEGV